MEAHLVDTSQRCKVWIYTVSYWLWQTCRQGVEPRCVFSHMDHVAAFLTDVAKARRKVWCFDMVVVPTEGVLVCDVFRRSAF